MIQIKLIPKNGEVITKQDDSWAVCDIEDYIRYYAREAGFDYYAWEEDFPEIAVEYDEDGNIIPGTIAHNVTTVTEGEVIIREITKEEYEN